MFPGPWANPHLAAFLYVRRCGRSRQKTQWSEHLREFRAGSVFDHWSCEKRYIVKSSIKKQKLLSQTIVVGSPAFFINELKPLSWNLANEIKEQYMSMPDYAASWPILNWFLFLLCFMQLTWHLSVNDGHTQRFMARIGRETQNGT